MITSESTILLKDRLDALSDFENHAYGCVIGAFLGDSIGSLLEMKENVDDGLISKALRMVGGGIHMVNPGQLTDDSELALSMASGIIEGDGILSIDRIAKYYSKWIRSSPFDIGKNTRKAFTTLKFKEKDEKNEDIKNWGRECYKSVRENCVSSESNGGLMRITPLAIFLSQLDDIEDVMKGVLAEQKLTHYKEEVLHAAVIYCLAIKHLVNNKGSVDGLFDFISTWIKKKRSSVVEYWNSVLNDEILPGFDNMGWAKIAWTYSFLALKENQEKSYIDIITDVLKRTGDTDTNCAIVGGLVGSRKGIKKLYQECGEKIEKMLTCNVLISRQPRDEFYAPINIINKIEMICKLAPKKLHIAEIITQENSVKEKEGIL